VDEAVSPVDPTTTAESTDRMQLTSCSTDSLESGKEQDATIESLQMGVWAGNI
jgi:hypothetical protein